MRSGDRRMPEEINRVLTDQISDLLFTTEPDGESNLLREGVAATADSFCRQCDDRHPAGKSRTGRSGGSNPGEIPGFSADDDSFGVLTLHRPSNVDDPVVLRRLLETLVELSERLPLIFPIHPRTRARIADAGLNSLLEGSRIGLTEPLGYLQLLGLMSEARLVLTDSGGLQEETTALGVPCITLRENTERPITVTQGTNTIVGTDVAKDTSLF